MFNEHLAFGSEIINLEQPITIHAVYQRAALYIDHYAAAYIILKHDQERGRVPKTIQEILDSNQFDIFAKMGELPGDYHDEQTAFLVLNLWKIPAIRMKNTYLHISTEFESLTNEIPIDITTKNEPAVYIPAKQIPQLFRASYEKPENLIQEYKQELKQALPENFDYWRNICCIAGTEIKYN